MSLSSVAPLRPVRVIDARLAFDPAPQFSVYSGGSRVTQQSYAATTATAQNINFSAVATPSLDTVVSRKMFIHYRVNLLVTSPAALSIGSTDAARSFPLTSLAQTVTLSLNGQNFQFPARDILKALSWSHRKNLQKHNDGCPVALDDCQSYADLVGSNKNPLGSLWTASGSDEPLPRGAFNYTVGVRDPATGVTPVSFECYEPVICSPMDVGDQSSGIVGLQTLGLQLQLEGNLNRMWSSAQAGVTVAAAPAGLFDVCELLVEYTTAPATMDLPKQTVLPWCDQVVQQSLPAAVAAGATRTFQSQSYQLPSIPDRVMVFCRRQNADEGASTPDAFLTMNRSSITFNNSAAILGTASQFQLYTISKENGIQMNWQSWSGQGFAANPPVAGAPVNGRIGTAGSVAMLRFGKDIPLDDTQSPGVAGSFQFSIAADFTNTSAAAVNAVMYCVFFYEGVVGISNGTCYRDLSVLKSSEIVETKLQAPVSDALVQAAGGSFSSMFSGLASKVKAAAPYVKSAASAAKKGLDAASALGLVGSGLVDRSKKLQGIEGGQIMKKQSLAARLR